MNETKKQFEEKMEKLRIVGLERQTLELLKTTRWGKIYAFIYLLVGAASIFLYTLVFNLNVFLSIFLGILTWFIISFVIDKILIKTYRIDTQLDWMLKTPEWLTELKKRGITDEQIEQLKKDLESNHLYKNFSLDKK